ncbi:MAG: hypothetical protein ACI96M_002871 [Candidatus Azotimanducaceae bacterium]|jgi:hypothetical protein
MGITDIREALLMLNRIWVAMVLLTFSTCPADAGAYKEGKLVKGVKHEAQIGMMKWGSNPVGEDRVVGTFKRFDIDQTVAWGEQRHLLEQKIVVTLDALDDKRELIDTIDIAFDMVTYGYRQKRGYYEAPYCVDFRRVAGARKVRIANVKIADTPKVYRTFNISNEIIKTGFKLPEPKAIPIKKE